MIPKISPSDLTKVLECVQALLVAQDLDQFTFTAIRVIPPLVNAVVAGYNEVDPPRGRFGFEVYPKEFIPEGAIEKWVKYAHENPLIQHVQKNPTDFSVHKITDFVSQVEFRRTGLCRELYKGTFDAEYQIAMPFPEPGSAAVAIAFNRATDFTERDRAILTVLQPLVVQAYRKAAALTDLRSAYDELRQSIDTLEPGLIIVSPDGSVTACSQKARTQLGLKADGEPATPVLLLAITNWLDTEVLVDGKESKATPLVIRRGKRQFSVSLVSRSIDRRVVLSVREVADKAQPSFQKLGLTKRESEVFSRLALGESNKQIARRFNITSRTIEKHIEHLLLKLKVSSRTAAGLMAASLMNAE